MAKPMTAPSAGASHWLRITLPAVTFVLAYICRARVGHRPSFCDVGGPDPRLVDRPGATSRACRWSALRLTLGCTPSVPRSTGFFGQSAWWLDRGSRTCRTAGGIGQALLQSGADALFLTAVWKRTGSAWLGLTAAALLATAPFDLCACRRSFGIRSWDRSWPRRHRVDPADWHRRSLVRAGVTAAIAWSAVHVYTGAIFVALSIFAALLVERMRSPRLARGLATRAGHRRRGRSAASPVCDRPGGTAIQRPVRMGAVTGSITGIMRGNDHLRLATSAAYVRARADTSFRSAHGTVNAAGWILLGCAVLLAVRYRHDPALLAVTLLPQLRSHCRVCAVAWRFAALLLPVADAGRRAHGASRCDSSRPRAYCARGRHGAPRWCRCDRDLRACVLPPACRGCLRTASSLRPRARS